MKENSAHLWDDIWKNESSKEEDLLRFNKEENSIRWQRIENVVHQEFGSFNKLKVIEIGAGTGTNAALMAKRGADVTILDYSKNALKKSQKFFKSNGVSAKFVQMNALKLSEDMINRYDLSLSFGLTEHFKGNDRVLINKAHFDVLRPGGVALISVPNKYNPPYRLFKFVAERTNRWSVGEEYPYSRKEFRDICRKIGIEKYSFFGDSLYSSIYFIRFISPVWVLRKLFGIKQDPAKVVIKKEKGCFLDQYLSYSLVLYGKK